MVIKKEDIFIEIKKNMRGGDGDVILNHLVPQQYLKHSRLIAKMIIPPGASIGEHEHINETEYYIILKGSAIVHDNDKEINVKEGDVVITSSGGKHSIKNNCDNDLEFIAIIILE